MPQAMAMSTAIPSKRFRLALAAAVGDEGLMGHQKPPWYAIMPLSLSWSLPRSILACRQGGESTRPCQSVSSTRARPKSNTSFATRAAVWIFGLKNYELQRVQKTLLEQFGSHLIRYRLSSFDEHVVGDTFRLCCEDRHPNRREDIEVVGLARKECLATVVDRCELYTGGIDCLAV